jgi:excisionase family DNA binding protein
VEDPSRQTTRAASGEPLLVTVREAARLLALGRSTVYELIAAGQLPTIHIGRSVRIRVDDLRALIDREDRADGAVAGPVEHRDLPVTRACRAASKSRMRPTTVSLWHALDCFGWPWPGPSSRCPAR